jgi:uncharacterized protein YneF (UPF0154 family)
MKQISTFILSLLVGMFIVSCCQSKELKELSPTSENGEKKMFSFKFGSTTEKMSSISIGNVYVCAVVIFNQFQF